jgi:tRNA-(ms[2]io[6]A)-hydroxylase
MHRMPREAELPLRYRTPGEWAELVLRDPLALLSDHGHLEKKAAINALELLSRWPDRRLPESWVRKLTAIARDEAEHLVLVARILERRGGQMTKFHRNHYANELRKLAARGPGGHDTLDRLMIAALIEARSCERFTLLAERCRDDELRRLYTGLWASEHGHFLTFQELFDTMRAPRTDVTQRWSDLLDAEAEITRALPVGPGILSGTQTVEA